MDATRDHHAHWESAVPLTVFLTLAAVRTALTTPSTGRHRREPLWRRATAALRFVLGIPDPADRHRPAHARRRFAAV
jgi:hypothetical protein